MVGPLYDDFTPFDFSLLTLDTAMVSYQFPSFPPLNIVPNASSSDTPVIHHRLDSAQSHTSYLSTLTPFGMTTARGDSFSTAMLQSSAPINLILLSCASLAPSLQGST